MEFPVSSGKPVKPIKLKNKDLEARMAALEKEKVELKKGKEKRTYLGKKSVYMRKHHEINRLSKQIIKTRTDEQIEDAVTAEVRRAKSARNFVDIQSIKNYVPNTVGIKEDTENLLLNYFFSPFFYGVSYINGTFILYGLSQIITFNIN